MEAANINIDDTALVERCQRGDSDAMERLILKYQDRIYNVILKICSNSDDAAELTQETFVKVIENIGRFQGRSSFYTWAFRIAVNLTLNYRKRNVKLAVRSLETQQGQADDSKKQLLRDFLRDDSASDPAGRVQRKELCEMAVRALMRLDDAQRTVVVLRDIEGMNYAQIAGVLDIQLGTVRSRLSRARSNLRDIMEAFLQ
ncbi:MAG: sigma-70 family RNA polymerase sigma factor [Sedimentisphaerales bacterium]|nr:sigma-70 family RNA polymerase sigma factor [Sedimentisphaerales bacterium]